MKHMYGKKLFLSSALGLSVLCMGFVSCSWQLPERVSVKAATELSVPLGTASLNMNDYLGMDKILDTVRGGLGGLANVYDFKRNADDDTLTYLVQYPMYQIPFDLSDYLGNMKVEDLLKDSTNGFNFEQSFTIPSVSVGPMEMSKTVDEILSSMMTGSTSVDGISVQVPEGSSTEISCTGAEGIKVNTGNAYSKGIKYTSGSSIEIKVVRTDSNPMDSGFTVKMKAKIPYVSENGYTYNGSSSEYVDVTNGGTFYLPVDNGTLPSDFPVVFEGTCKGGSSPAVLHDYDISFTLKDDSSIYAVYEIDTDPAGETPIVINDIDIAEISVPLDSLPSTVIEAVLGDASMKIVSAKPEGWDGVNLALKSFTLTGLGSTYTESDFADVGGSGYFLNKKLDLSGAVIVPGSTIKASGKVGIDVDGATIVVNGVNKVSSSVSLDINSLSTVAVDMKDVGKNIADSTINIPAGTGKYLKQIKFGELSGSSWVKKDADGNNVPCEGFGIKCDIVNSLPAGSNIPVTIVSESLGIKGSEKISTVISGTGNTDSKSVSLTSHPTVQIAEGNLGFDVQFGGAYTDGSGASYTSAAVLKDIVPGSTYTLKMDNAQLVCDWSSAKVDMTGVTINNQFDLNNIDLKTIFKDLPISIEDIKKIKFDSLNAYFYAQKPSTSKLAEKLGEIALGGDIKLEYTADGASEKTVEYLLSSASGKSVTFVDTINWPDANTKLQINAENFPEILSALDEKKTSFSKNLAPIINALPSDLLMEYNLKLSNKDGTTDLDIYPHDLVSTDPVSVAIDLVIELPFALTLDGEIGMNIMDYVREDTGTPYGNDNPPPDLLGRAGAADFETYSKYADSIDFFKLKYVVHNDVIPGFKGSITIRDKVVDSASQIETSCKFESGTQEAELTGAQLKSILTSYPFNPDVIISFGSSEGPTSMHLSRAGLASEKSLGAKVIVDFKMNEDVPIEVWKRGSAAAEGGE